MKTFYFTFGQIHRHVVNDIVFDKNVVVRIDAEDYDSARGKMFELFGKTWASQYRELPNMDFYSRGIIDATKF